MVYKHGGVLQPGTREQHGKSARIHPAGDSEKHSFFTDLFLYPLNQQFYRVLRGPIPRHTRELEEVLEDRPPPGCVNYFG